MNRLLTQRISYTVSFNAVQDGKKVRVTLRVSFDAQEEPVCGKTDDKGGIHGT